MTLKAVVENLDDVPEAFHGEYLEKDGKFFLDIDGTIKDHTAVTPLARALQTVKDEKKALQTKLSDAEKKTAPEGFTAEKWAELQELEDKLKKDPGYKGGGNDESLQRMKDQLNQQIANLKKDHAAELAAKDTLLATERGILDRRVSDDELTQALANAGVSGPFLKAARSMLKSAIKVAREENEDPRVFVETDLGEQSVAQFVDAWAKSDEGKHFVPAPQGGGARGSSSGRGEPNPFSAQDWNSTEQGRIVREKGIEHATRLAKAAGTTVGGPRPERKAA